MADESSHFSQIVGTSADPRTHTSHERHGVKHDESRDKQPNHNSQTRAKENDSLMNLESVLFDREQLKNYVLDYLRTRGFAQSTAAGHKNSLDHELKSAGRQSEHRDKLESRISSYSGTEHKHGHLGAREDHRSDSQNEAEDLYNGERNSLNHKHNSAGRHSEHRDKLESRISSYDRKHKHGHHGAREDHRSDSQNEAEDLHNSERNSLNHKTSSAGRHNEHRDKLDSRVSSYNGKHKHRNHDAYENEKSGSLYEEHSTNRRNFVSKEKSHHKQPRSRDHFEKHRSLKKYPIPIYLSEREEKGKKSSKQFSSHHRHLVTKAKQSTGRKHSVNGEQNDSKRKTVHLQSKHGNEKANKVSTVHTLPHSLHHAESVYKKDPVGKKQRATHRDTSHQPHKHYHRSDKNGNLKRDKTVSKSIFSSRSLNHKGNHKSMKGLHHKKSNKRTFIAVHPPQSFKLEGFDVEPVRPKLSHDKKKRKASKRQRHINAKKNESHEHKQMTRRKSIMTAKSHRDDHDIKKGRAQNKSQWQEADRKSTVTQKSSKKNHRQRSESVAQKDSSQQKAKRKNSVRPALSKHQLQEKEHHNLGHKRTTVHRKEKSTAHKRKKTSRHQDTEGVKFSPSWKSLDKRKIPSWYDDAKFGIFVHWGVYSVPSFDSEWFWYKWKGRQLQKYLNYTGKNFPPGFSYNEFAPLFKAEFFDAKQWAELVARSGARYFVFTSKHHEGFTNWNSSVAWNWNSVDIGPHRNIVDELARAFRNLSDPQVKFGLYYSLFEWFNPHYLKDKANGFKTDEYIEAVMKPQLYDLVNTYKPDYLWTDGEWEANYTYWRSTEFLAWLFNDSPVKDTVVVNDRWGRSCRCHHGGVCTGQDRFNPGKLQKMKWENAMTIDRHSWGFRRDANIKDYFGIEELIKQLVTTVSCGGNLLMNVGPASDGTISPIFQERLTQMGDWLKVNGDAIYKTKPWRAQNDSVSGDVWYTSKGKHVFAIALSWPRSRQLVLGDPTATPQTRVTMLGTKKHLTWTHRSKHTGGIVIDVPTIPVSDLPCLWAWVFKLSHVK